MYLKKMILFSKIQRGVTHHSHVMYDSPLLKEVDRFHFFLPLPSFSAFFFVASHVICPLVEFFYLFFAFSLLLTSRLLYTPIPILYADGTICHLSSYGNFVLC